MIIAIGVAFAMGFIGWVYVALLKPPSPKLCGSPNGPPLSSPRVKLSDGRHLAYKELGVRKEEARYKIIISHGLYSCKDMDLPISQERMEELKLYIVIYDRAGHCESDPYPSRSVRTEAFDIQELADKLELGTKFYVMGCSVGAYAVWGCLNYIPHRLLGASLVVPTVNFWWSSFPSYLSQRCFAKYPQSYKRMFWIAYYTPWLMYWWLTQKWFPNLDNEDMLSNSDLVITKRLMERPDKCNIVQQGEHECIHKDLLCNFGKWEFDPMELSNPFPHNKGSFHMWQGSEDRIVPIELNRFIVRKLPWIQYHEIYGTGHFLVHDAKNLEAIIRALLVL
ncbi:uncharacterized protein LOC111787652 [Cucurbita pepo subsp. pepo]|uniref:uncharacterized protein LOC111787652 n=1 Tax=Cucurbita pepo subsp. pepo TaxID=3664 RepID=UPI000C9D2EDF|nr:uncharacterized protein LOC111787652 [Cucurbita pepo subsp. pepo]